MNIVLVYFFPLNLHSSIIHVVVSQMFPSNTGHSNSFNAHKTRLSRSAHGVVGEDGREREKLGFQRHGTIVGEAKTMFFESHPAAGLLQKICHEVLLELKNNQTSKIALGIFIETKIYFWGV